MLSHPRNWFYQNFYLDFLYLGEKTFNFEAHIEVGEKTQLLGDLDIDPIYYIYRYRFGDEQFAFF